MDRIGRLQPLDVYFYAHNEVQWIIRLFGKPYQSYPEINWHRIRMAWRAKFLLDDSGRSTAKTYDHMLVGVAKCALFRNRMMDFFAIDKEKGVEIFDQYIDPWIQSCDNFIERLEVAYNSKEPKIIHSQSGAKLKFKNLSVAKTYTPGIRTGGKKALSDRANHVIFNEWTSWPGEAVNIIEDRIKPIATRGSLYNRKTIDLRIVTETSLGIPLGRISNETLSEWNHSKPGYVPRPHLLERKPDDSFEVARKRFLRNFRIAFGFNYEDGIKDAGLNFRELNSVDDIVDFFKDYLKGDPVYQNQIVYDSSAQRPSDPHYEFVEYFWRRIDAHDPAYEALTDLTVNADYIKEELKKVENPDPRYHWFNCTVDDIPERYDGIIYDSDIINDARGTMLDEDFQRIYGGRWREGSVHKPFSMEDINKCRQDPNVTILTERDNAQSIFILALDAAQGTDRLRKGEDNRNTHGKGDDAAGCVCKVGMGTPEKPHSIHLIYKAEDVSKDPMAVDVHRLHQKFGFDLIPLDPGGGGKALAERLEKRKILIDDQVLDFVPLVPIDYIHDNDGYFPPIQHKLVFISRSTKMITEIWRQSFNMPPFKDDGEMRNAMIVNAQTLFAKQGVVFPPALKLRQMIALRNHGKMTDEDMRNQQNLEEAIVQMSKIHYEMDKKTNQRVKTNSGHFKYVFPRRKDLAMVIVYALFMAQIYVKWAGLTDQNTDELPIAIGG